MALAWAVDQDPDYGQAARPAPNLRLSGSPDAIGETTEPAGASATGPLLVLVADDEPTLRTSLSAILENAGHRVVEAEDGQVALRLLSEQSFDVLVLDLYMPKFDGMDLLRQLQAPPPIVIIYSAFAYFSLPAVRDEVGAKVFRYMQKPVPPLEFLAAINEAATELDR